MVKESAKAKKPKLSWWKKQGPELASIAEHIGKMTDNMKFNDWAEVALIGTLAYIGAERTRDWRGAVIGPIGLKLATTMGGTPPIAQIAGLSILGVMGLLVIGAHPELHPFGVTPSEIMPEWWPKFRVG